MDVLGVAFLMAIAITSAASNREKRLVLHSDTDIAGEVVRLRSEVASLSATFGIELSKQNASFEATIAKLVSTISSMDSKLQKVEGALNAVTNNDHGSIYVRWGRTTCGRNGTQLVYKGYVGGSPSDYVCVDADTEFIVRGAANTQGNLLYLVEGICGTLVCPPYFNHRELACSVCSK